MVTKQQETAALYIQIMSSRCGKLIRLHAFHSGALILHSRAEALIPMPWLPFPILHSHAVASIPDPPFPCRGFHSRSSIPGRPSFPKLHFRLTISDHLLVPNRDSPCLSSQALPHQHSKEIKLAWVDWRIMFVFPMLGSTSCL